MSRALVTIVYSRRLGSAHRKAVMAYLADRASDDGTGIFASKQTVASATECSRSTVIKAVNEFLAEGILKKTGKRPCSNGATTIYAISINHLNALPPATPDPSVSRTSASAGLVRQPDPSVSRTRPVRQPDPKPSVSRTLTVHEPSMNQESPADSCPSDDEPEEKPQSEITDLAAKAMGVDLVSAFDAFDAAAAENGWPAIAKRTTARKSKLRARIKDAGGLDGWAAALAKAAASDFCCGRAPPGGGRDKPFVLTFDFLVQESSFTKLMEGNYDNRTSKGARGSGNAAAGGRPTSMAGIVAQRRLASEG